MERWAQALESQLTSQNDTYSRCIGTLRSSLGAQVKRVNCGKCDAETWIGALIKFPCELKYKGRDYEVEHTLCFDCLEDKLERHRGFLERERTNPAKKALYDKCLECIVCCEECHTPAVISRVVGYEGGIQAGGADEGSGRRRVRYMIHQQLTDALKLAWGTHSFYENQRRSPFSKFSKDKLLPIERPHISDENGLAVDGEDRSLETGYVWLEDWKVVTNIVADEFKPKENNNSTSTAVMSATTSNSNNNTTAASKSGNANDSSLLATSASNGASAAPSSQASLLAGGAYANDPVSSGSFIGLSRSNTLTVEGTATGPKKTKHEKKMQEEIEQMVTDPSGWQYAFLWPVPEGYVKWKNEPSVHKTFVRRRKKTRAFLRLTDDLKKKLTEFCNSSDQKQ